MQGEHSGAREARDVPGLLSPPLAAVTEGLLIVRIFGRSSLFLLFHNPSDLASLAHLPLHRGGMRWLPRARGSCRGATDEVLLFVGVLCVKRDLIRPFGPPSPRAGKTCSQARAASAGRFVNRPYGTLTAEGLAAKQRKHFKRSERCSVFAVGEGLALPGVLSSQITKGSRADPYRGYGFARDLRMFSRRSRRAAEGVSPYGQRRFIRAGRDAFIAPRKKQTELPTQGNADESGKCAFQDGPLA